MRCKPMNCPGHVQIFKQGLKSYRDLPLRLAEFGWCHRYEPSGALHGLMRVRHFTQDDAHIFCTEDQITEECVKLIEQLLSIYQDFGFDRCAHQALRPAGQARRHRRGLGQGRSRVEARDARQPACDYELNSGRGRVLRAEARIRADRRDRPRLAVRHHPGRPQPADAARRELYRARTATKHRAGHAAPRDLRLVRALHRHPDRALRRQAAVLARAGAGGGGHHRLGRR